MAVKFTQPQRARLGRLLHMEYTPRELARELECSPRQILRAVEAGCPHRRIGNRTWLVGDAFAAWYIDRTVERKRPSRQNQSYCLHCRGPVPLGDNVTVTPSRAGVERVSGVCPQCNNPIHRFRSVRA